MSFLCVVRTGPMQAPLSFVPSRAGRQLAPAAYCRQLEGTQYALVCRSMIRCAKGVLLYFRSIDT